MKEEIRRAIAVNAVARVTGKSSSSVYSHDDSTHTPMGSGYDYAARAHFSEDYHYGTRSHMSLQVRGETFSGYNYDSGHHYSGTVKGNTVQIFDFGENKYYQYTV
jgi:hypothetical protein